MRVVQTLLFAMLTIADVTSAAGWRALLNGKDLTSWEMVGPGRFVVENDLLKTEGGMGLLYYGGKKFGNCTIRVVFRELQRANSGLFIRIPEPPLDPWIAVNTSYEVQIAGAGSGCLYSFTRPLKSGLVESGKKRNTMDVVLDGQRTVVYINGEKVTDHRTTDPAAPRKS